MTMISAGRRICSRVAAKGISLRIGFQGSSSHSSLPSRPFTTSIFADLLKPSKKLKFRQDDQVLTKQQFLNSTPEINFENSLKIATPKEIYEFYLQTEKKLVKEEDYLELLSRISKGYFGYLNGHKLFKLAVQIKQDMAHLNPGMNVDAMIVNSAQFLPPKEISQVVNHIAKVAGTPQEKQAIYVAFLKVIGQLGFIEASEEVFQRLEKDTAAYKAMCHVYASVGDLKSVEALFQQWESKVKNKPTAGDVDSDVSKSKKVYESNLDFYIALLRASVMDNDLQKVRKYVSKFASAQEHYQLIAQGALLECYANRGLPGDANQAYKELRLKGLPATQKIYEQMIKVCLVNKDLAGASKWFHKIKGASKNPSIGMVTAMMNVQLKSGEPLVAYKTISEGLSVFKKRSGSTRVQFSAEMAQILAEDLKGKHIDYLRDNLRLSFLPMRYRGELVAKIMSASLQPKFQDEPLVDLVITLYNEFHVVKGCVNDIPPSHVANISVIEAYGIKGMVDKAEKVFKDNIDTSFAREKDYYNSLITVYNSNEQRTEAAKLLKDFKKQGLKYDVGTIEAALIGEKDKTLISYYMKEIVDGGIMAHPKLHPTVFRLCVENKVPLVPSLLGL